jgi:cytochrome bd ubiquinol oxidase subunit II
VSISFDLNSVWFLLVGVLFTGYAVLDGFDLGVGALHLFARGDRERRTLLNAIGPVWDGNEVWLVTGGGALFAAFPIVYATIFSGFYLALMYLLLALIFRAVAIEFRSKQPMGWWRGFWDWSFSISSITSALLLGVALGNIAWGIPLTADHEYYGSLLGLLRPYPLLIGITTVALFTMHGAIYVVMKTEGEIHARAQGWVRNGIIFFVLSYVTTTMATLLFVPNMTREIVAAPELFAVPLIGLLAIANIPREMYYGRDGRAFVSSCVSMMALMALFGIGLYPTMVFSNPVEANSLTIYNAASSQMTLSTMLIIAAIGMPIVLSYTAAVYWLFRGKVKLDAASY